MSSRYGPPIGRLLAARRFDLVATRAIKAGSFIAGMLVAGQLLKAAFVTMFGSQLGEGMAATLALVPTFALLVLIDRRVLRVQEKANG